MSVVKIWAIMGVSDTGVEDRGTFLVGSSHAAPAVYVSFTLVTH